MRLTVVGSGDAFGSGGRANTCFILRNGRLTAAIDFGATSLVEMRRHGIDPRSLDVIVLSHLHGDHFGGIPFLLLHRQFDSSGRRPLTIVGPVGTRDRLLAASEVFFPASSTIEWKFPLTIVEMSCGEPREVQELRLVSYEVIHPSGAPATGLRVGMGGKLVAYSGDTEWTDALFDVARGADLFICECYKPDGAPVHHMSFATIVAQRRRVAAKAIMLTHMSDAMLDRMDEAKALGFLVAHDGLVLDL